MLKKIGLVALVVGIFGFFISLNMDTSVGTSELGRRVNNIGLMNDKQNLLLMFSVVSIIGAIFFTLSGRGQEIHPHNPLIKEENNSPAERTCPFCAEKIRAEAKICRFCQRDIYKKSAEFQNQLYLPLDFEINTSSASGCVAALVALGYRVTRPTEGKWEIVHPTNQVIAFAYSATQLKSVTERITSDCAVKTQA